MTNISDIDKIMSEIFLFFSHVFLKTWEIF